MKGWVRRVEQPAPNRPRRSFLYKIAYKNAAARKSRTLLTVGGLAVAFGMIIFLVSLGYGLEKLVVGQVATSQQLAVADILPEKTNVNKINGQALARFASVDYVEAVYPAVSVAARASLAGSLTDVVVVATEPEFAYLSGVEIIRGEMFGDKGQVVVNLAALRVLDIKESEAIDKAVNLSFILPPELAEEFEERQTLEPAPYAITGVFDDGEARPKVYLELANLTLSGVTNYTQAKVVVAEPERLAEARRHIENMGFVTTSVVDTISQIQSIFATIRLVLAVFGAFALAVAALGMFNTLSVSLFERTREVALLRALGMQAGEVRELFFLEALMLSLAGVMGGLVLGVLLGVLASAVLSALSLASGGSFLAVSSIPLYFILVILLISVAVGILTGLYPARRATRISALDALRYE